MSSRSHRFARNMSWNLLGQVGTFLVSFTVTPYLVHHMGVETYGLYVLLFTAANYLTLFSFGAGSATTKFSAEYAGAGDGGKVARVFELSWRAHGLGGVVGGALFYVWAPALMGSVFKVPADLVGVGVFVVRCAAVGAVFVGAKQVGFSTLSGLQKFGRQNALLFALNLLTPLAAAAAFVIGHGLRAAAVSYVVVNALIGLASYWVARRELGGAAPKAVPNREFARYSLVSWLGSMAWLVSFHADKLFIAHDYALSDLTLYSVPAGILQRLQIVPALFGTALFPLLAELGAHEAKDSLPRIYLKSLRALLLVVLPILVFLFALMPQFLSVWLGPEFGTRSVWPARLLVLASLFYMLAAPGQAVAASRGKPEYASWLAWTQALAGLAAWTWLIPRYGILGAAAGTLLSQAVPVLVFLVLVHRKVLGLSGPRYAREGLLAAGAGAALALAVVMPLHHLAQGWVRLIAFAAVGAALYYGAAWAFLSAEDKALVRSLLRVRRA